MAEQTDQSQPTSEGKSLIEWTEQETYSFGGAFSLQDFEFVRPQREGVEGYVRIRIPNSVEPMLTGLLAAERRTGEAFRSPLDPGSQQEMKKFLGDTVNAGNIPEEVESGWIQTFGQLVEVADMTKDRPDQIAGLQAEMRMLNHQYLTTTLKVILKLALEFSVEKYLDSYREKYGHPENLPKDIEQEIMRQNEKYEQVKALIDRDPQAGQMPRFVVVNSAGNEIFRSVPILE